MQFGFLGINYNKASLDIRDKVAFTETMKMKFLSAAEALGVEQCMVLSTCNRSEIYFFYEEEEQFVQMRVLYERTFEAAAPEQYLISYTGETAISYLFRIAAGLESLVLGEDQILGQVKEALDFSRTMGHSKKELNKVVRDAITCAKRIKTELRISEKPLSVSYIGILQLDKIAGIRGKRVLVIGSGKTAVLAIRYLYEYGAKNVTVCSRTLANAKALRQEFPDMRVVPYEQRYEALEVCEIVISATSSPHLVVKKEKLKQRGSITFLDLASPRDIDAGVADLEGVALINLDSLLVMVEENKRERQRLVEESRQLIGQGVRETMDWLKVSRMDATIESLQQRCSEIVEDSYDYLNRRIVLNTREQKILRKVLNASLQRLLHEPIRELKQLETPEEQDTYKALIERLFQM